MNDEEVFVEESPTKPPAVEPNWRAIGRKHEEIANHLYSLANAIDRRNKATAELDSAVEAIGRYDSKVTALQAELIELEEAK